MSLGLSVVILTKNEEDSVVDCIDSVFPIADEIVVVDDYSTDRTIEVIKKISDKIIVLKHRLNNDFSSQRNFGLSKTKNKWVLFIDADERISQNLANELRNILTNPKNTNIDAYLFKRIDNLWGKNLRHGEIGNIRLLRLATKNSGSWVGRIHEEWKVSGKVVDVENPIIHYPHQQIREFLQEVNYYTSIRAEDLFGIGKKVYVQQIIFYPIGKFLINYVLRLGFLDGIRGFVFASIMSFHSFLVRGKLWILWNQKRRI